MIIALGIQEIFLSLWGIYIYTCVVVALMGLVQSTITVYHYMHATGRKHATGPDLPRDKKHAKSCC